MTKEVDTARALCAGFGASESVEQVVVARGLPVSMEIEDLTGFPITSFDRPYRKFTLEIEIPGHLVDSGRFSWVNRRGTFDVSGGTVDVAVLVSAPREGGDRS